MIGIGSSTRFSILKSRNESNSANQVFDTTNIYLKTLIMFAPAFMLNHLLQCFVRNDGYPSLSMAAMMTGSFSYIIWDYIFIFPLNMGIFGAAFSTGLSPMISMLVLLPYFIKKKNSFHLAAFNLAQMKKIPVKFLPTASLPMISMLVLLPYFIKKKNSFHLAAFNLAQMKKIPVKFLPTASLLF